MKTKEEINTLKDRLIADVKKHKDVIEALQLLDPSALTAEQAEALALSTAALKDLEDQVAAFDADLALTETDQSPPADPVVVRVPDFGKTIVKKVLQWNSGETAIAGSNSITEVELENAFLDGSVVKLFAVYFNDDSDPLLSTASLTSSNHSGLAGIIRTILNIDLNNGIESEALIGSSIAQKSLDLMANRIQPYIVRLTTGAPEDTSGEKGGET